MNKNMNALLMLLMVGGFAMPTSQLQAAGVEQEGKRIGKSLYTVASEYCNDLYIKVTSGLAYQKKKDKAIEDAGNKEEAYDAGFSDGVAAAVDQSTFDDYKEVREELKIVNKHEGQLGEQGRQLGEQDTKIDANGKQAAENKGAIEQINTRVDAHEQRIQKVEDGRKTVDALLSVRGGMVTASMGIAAGQMNKIAPSLANPIIQSAGSIALGIGITAFAIQGFCIWPDKIAAQLGHLNKFGINYGWYLGQGLGYAAATASVLGGVYIVHKASQKDSASSK